VSAAQDRIRALYDAEIARFPDRPESPAFTRDEYGRRLDRLRAGMEAAGVELLLLTAPDAMCWLHGYRARWYRGHSPTAWPPLQLTAVHVDHDRMLQFDHAAHEHLIHATSIVEELRLADREDLDGGLAFIVESLAREGWLGGTVGLEHHSHIPNRAVSEAYESALADRGCRVVDATAVIRGARRIKSPAEIAKIEEATRICDIGLRALEDVLAPGITELEAWVAMMAAMVQAGGEPAALHERVSVGGTHMGHSISSRRVLREGDFIGADPCGVVDRYHGNVCRQFVLGEPPPGAVELSRVQGGAFDVLAGAGKAGTPVREVNAALREYYRDAGVWDMRGWLGGYELGISFPPDWVGEFVFDVEEEDPDGVFEAGLVTNYESIVLHSMIDTVVFEPDGARLLSSLPRELAVVPL
jgi:Xaa-Pro dipeptidase